MNGQVPEHQKKQPLKEEGGYGNKSFRKEN
jgi:hypothetical protein